MGKFWNGDVRLVKAYWIYGVLLPNGLFVLAWLSGMRLVPGSATAILIGLAVLAYLVFWGVGTWRSATRYTGPKVWAILTKAHLALPLVGLILAIAVSALWSSKPDEPERFEVETKTGAPTGDSQQSHPVAGSSIAHQPHVQIQPSSATGDAGNGAAQSHSDSSHLTQSNHGQKVARVTSMAEARKRLPELSGLSDESALNVIHQAYYPQWDKAKLAEALGVALPTTNSAMTKPKLGWLDQSRYESCQQDAAKAPTPHGVNVGLRICREKFNQ